MNIRYLAVRQIIIGLILLAASSGLVYAHTGGLHNFTWQTIDTGGEYARFNIMGQPEAQAAMPGSGRYALPDGFWPHLQIASVCPSGASLGYSPTNPDPGQSTTFSGQISGGNGVITFTWNFGDNSGLFFGQNTSHIYNAHNVYTVVMTASGDLGCTPLPNVATATANITVGFGIPTAVIYLPAILKGFSGDVLPTTAELVGDVSDGRPSLVTGLWGMSAADGAGIIIGWTANPPEETVAGYHIYRRARSSDGPFARLATVPVASTVYADTSAVCGQIYYVTAFDLNGESLPGAAAYYAPACP